MTWFSINYQLDPQWWELQNLHLLKIPRYAAWGKKKSLRLAGTFDAKINEKWKRSRVAHPTSRWGTKHFPQLTLLMVSGVIFDLTALRDVVQSFGKIRYLLLLPVDIPPSNGAPEPYLRFGNGSSSQPLESTLGSNLTRNPFSVSVPRTHYQG